MTREEAIQVLNMVEAHGSLVIQAKEMAIKALEQEVILDKIRTEIKCMEYIEGSVNNSDEYEAAKEDALEIIDKYRQVEQEPKTDIFDKIREEIEEKYIGCDICKWVEEKNEDGIDISDYSPVGTIQGILQIIDKYKQTEPKTDIALERYKDLQDYFANADISKSILENREEFKAWLERLRWNTKKVDELARKLEALEQEPCGDCISRVRVLEQINCWVGSGEYRHTIANWYLGNRIKDLPSVQPKVEQEPRIGHWKKLDVGYGCSECSLATNEYGKNDYKYCPNCGAKMEG